MSEEDVALSGPLTVPAKVSRQLLVTDLDCALERREENMPSQKMLGWCTDYFESKLLKQCKDMLTLLCALKAGNKTSHVNVTLPVPGG